MNSEAGKNSWYSFLLPAVSKKQALFTFEEEGKKNDTFFFFFHQGKKDASVRLSLGLGLFILLAARNQLFSEAKAQVTGPM